MLRIYIGIMFYNNKKYNGSIEFFYQNLIKDNSKYLSQPVLINDKKMSIVRS